MLKQKTILIYLSFLFSSITLKAQTYTFSGFIKDVKTGESLVGANIFIKEINNGTTTNNYGFYSFSVPTGLYHISFSYVGYHDSDLTISLDTNKNIDISLSIVSMRGAVVRANSNISKEVGMSRIDIPIQQLTKIPAIMGEVDVIKAIQLLPGVKSGNEGSSGLYVRGGSPDQNLILLDGVPVYNVNHLFGFFSVFNSDAINNIQLYKGGFPSRYGGRLSSIIDIGMKEGNKEKLHGNFSVSPIAGRFSIDGPLTADGKTTFAFSFRRTWIDLLTKPFMSQAANFGYFFYDLNAKISHQINRKERIFFSVYKGEDKFYANTKTVDYNGGTKTTETSNNSLGWGNSTAVLRYYRLINKNFFSNYALSYTSYIYKLGINFDYRQTSDTSSDRFSIGFNYGAGIRDYSLRSDYELGTDSRHKIRFGGIYTLHTFAPGSIKIQLVATPNFNFDTTIGPKKRILSHEAAGYIEDEYMLNYSLKALYGLRMVAYVADGKGRFFVEPRISLRQMLQNNAAIKFSYTLMNQPIHLLTNNGLGLPVDIWVPATSKIRPQRAHQVAIGITQPWKKNIEFSIEWYYKAMTHVIDYSEGADFTNVQVNWENKVKSGKGQSYGMEVLLQKKSGKASGWLGYTLAWANRTIKGINFDKTYPIKFDRRHQLTAVFIYDIDKKFSFQATFVLSTGNAITFPQGRFYTADGFAAYDYGSKNASRMPTYHRLDLGLINKLKPNNTSRKYEESLNFSFYNFYNQFNPFYMDINNRNGNRTVRGYQYFGFLPTIAYNVKF